MPCPSHSSRFDHPNNTGWGVKIIRLLIMSYSPLPFTLSLLGPNILLSTLLSHTLSLSSSLIVIDQVSHPYNTTGKLPHSDLKKKCLGISKSLKYKDLLWAPTHHHDWNTVKKSMHYSGGIGRVVSCWTHPICWHNHPIHQWQMYYSQYGNWGGKKS